MHFNRREKNLKIGKDINANNYDISEIIDARNYWVMPGSSNIVGGQWVFIKTHGRSIDNMVVLEPSAMKVAFGENAKANYNKKNMMPTTRMSIAALLREEIFEAQQYNKNKKNAKKSGESFKEEFRKDADIAIFNGNPMETFTKTMYTIIEGEIVYKSEDIKS